MATYLSHGPVTSGDLSSLAFPLVPVVEAGTANTVTLATINEHGLAPSKALVASTKAGRSSRSSSLAKASPGACGAYRRPTLVSI
jgi:hypothetical protein